MKNERMTLLNICRRDLLNLCEDNKVMYKAIDNYFDKAIKKVCGLNE